ncbi:unnamed protein product [Fusarium graminearum]|uniref:Chromosome 3, complete genome n=1 Tax=Gibberella zeae (strain ATCC MYA-4620 / CBS 123657 / FGSC 9075 / NRRL 31084 / PH-1) TaxID=229533 RepID=A0A0E0SN92_GIBZE|nr:hypothetical protein FG05_35128 [Fusarium graminearum]CEF87905.1 unnamed protein product [Fusarium graminearum]
MPTAEKTCVLSRSSMYDARYGQKAKPRQGKAQQNHVVLESVSNATAVTAGTTSAAWTQY